MAVITISLKDPGSDLVRHRMTRPAPTPAQPERHEVLLWHYGAHSSVRQRWTHPNAEAAVDALGAAIWYDLDVGWEEVSGERG